ncbi:hypothetical protein [Streptomyces sp. NPDC059468]|uniref:hypothetical protein n=1 Tax=Streptomyces sp. NPDC059468 TaxID=3346845 RepID=UPI00368879AE
MKKIMWRISSAGISAVLAGGALLAAGGSATAATYKANEPTKVVVGESQNRPGGGSRSDDYRHAGEQRGAHDLPDPWVAGQLTVFNPWIADQLATFAPSDDVVR